MSKPNIKTKTSDINHQKSSIRHRCLHIPLGPSLLFASTLFKMLNIASRLFVRRVQNFARIPSAAHAVVCHRSLTLSTAPVAGTATHVKSFQLLLTSAFPQGTASVSNKITEFISSLGLWLIKRTYQPSILRKKRKHGFLKRTSTVGGRRTTRRRKAKGRARIYGA